MAKPTFFVALHSVVDYVELLTVEITKKIYALFFFFETHILCSKVQMSKITQDISKKTYFGKISAVGAQNADLLIPEIVLIIGHRRRLAWLVWTYQCTNGLLAVKTKKGPYKTAIIIFSCNYANGIIVLQPLVLIG